MSGEPVTCPDFETLAAFAEGRLSRDEAAAVMAHLDGCEDCLAAVEIANETVATRNVVPFKRRRPWLLAVAAAVIAAVVGVAAFRDRIAGGSPVDALIEHAPRSARAIEARPSGGFPWAAYRGPMRADEADADPQRMKLIGAAGELVAAADADSSSDAQQAAGIALMMTDRPTHAIDRLRRAVEASPRDANAWSDLAAAQYSAALGLSRPSLLPSALESADQALRLEPRLAEGRFNRALILERLGLAQEAAAAWEAYLEVDAASPWAIEARQRLARLKTIAAPSQQSDPQRMRTFAEAETLGRWAEAAKIGDVDGAHRELNMARAVGKTLEQTTRESLLSEAVLAIETADDRATLAEAHSIYRRGRIAYSRRQLDAALTDLTRAAALFEQGRSPMALVARYYAACVRFDNGDVSAARAELQSLLNEADQQTRFIALGAQVRWELALSLMIDGDWSGALPLLEEARTSFRSLDERNHLGFIESLLADTLLSMGRADDAWAARIRAFTLLSAAGNGDRLPASINAAAQMEARSGRLRTARALLAAALATARPIQDQGIAADLLIHAALVNAALGERDDAERSVRDARAAVAQIGDAATREVAESHLELAGAATLLEREPARAANMLTQAIDGYRANGRTVFLPECFLLRARAALRQGQTAAASDDLESGIAALERSRVRTGAVIGTGVHDAGNALFEEAIRLSAARGDLDAAFAYAERSRAQLFSERPTLLTNTRDLQQRLGTSDAAVLHVLALPDELVAMCVTARGRSMKRQPIDREAVRALAERSASAEEDRPSLAKLHELLIEPFDALLAPSRQLIVIADRSLQIVPFAALYDTSSRRYLVERIAVSTAMSASTLQPVPVRGNRVESLLAVVLPSGASNAGLPETMTETAEVAPLYARAVTIPPERATFAAFSDSAGDANVIHIAGHTERQSDDAGTALMFARERVTWSAIALRRLPRAPVVVLAACATLLQRAPAHVRSLTPGEGFIAAGASDVVGTLAPIADADARELFRAIHRSLAAGAMPYEAVRAAQVEEIARGSGAWRAVASLTRRIYTREERI